MRADWVCLTVSMFACGRDRVKKSVSLNNAFKGKMAVALREVATLSGKGIFTTACANATFN